jgi:NAD(P)-dependent dehydrogenase (short-subunit alcohol dehydrogenase family)
MGFAGRTALVTGGVRRVGLSIARAIASEGARVVVTYSTSKEEEVEAALSLLRESGAAEAFAYRADLADRDGVERAIAQIAGAHDRIDLLVNSAANFIRHDLADVTWEEFDATFALNARAPFFLSQAFGSAMLRNGYGRIVNLADVAATVPWPAHLPYSMSKGAIVTMTRGLAKALAPHVLVNAVAPGPVLMPEHFDATQIEQAVAPTLLKRLGSAEDVATAVLFLLSSDYITGVTLPVDGGRLLR